MATELEIIRRQHAIFARFTSRALVETSLDALFLDACISARAGLHSGFAKVLEYLPDSDSLLLRSGVGWKPGYVGVYTTTADLESAIGYAFSTSEPVAVSHYGEQAQFFWPQILKDHDCQSSVNVPLRGETGMFGVLEVDDIEKRDYSPDDILFLTGLSNTIARAVELNKLHSAKDRALAEKDLLMREMNHRNKNNLSLVASMLGLQSRRFKDTTVRREFQDAAGRVSTLAHIYDRMQHGVDEQPEASEFFNELCGMMRSLLPENVTLTGVADGNLPGRPEIFALLVNEVVTNACKYAFPQRPGTISISFSSSAAIWKLEIADDGIGLPADVDPDQSTSFGMTLIRSFAMQLDASVSFEASAAGTRVQVASRLAGS